MPPYRITVEKSGYSMSWVNVYYAAGTGVDQFTAEVNGIVAAERPLLLSTIAITKVRVDDQVKGTDNYRTYTINQMGTRASQVSDTAPLWVTARIDFNTATGRPSRKYIRGSLVEADFNMVQIVTGTIAMYQAYGDAIVNLAAIVDVDGQDFTSATVFQAPQMRQLRRGSKKKATP